VRDFRHVVMGVNRRAHLDFLDVDGLLFFTCFALSTFLLVYDLFVVNNFAYRWLCFGRDFDEVKSCLGCHPQCISQLYYAGLLIVLVNQSYFRTPNVLINSDAVFNSRIPRFKAIIAVSVQRKTRG